MENTALVRATPAAVALQDQMSQADIFYKSGLFKDVTDAAQAFVKIVKGHEIGLQPMAAMEGFDIVQGRLRMTARCAAALVNVCHYADYTPISHDDTQCTIRFHKKTREGWVDHPDVTYTIEIAKARGALDKGKRQNGTEYEKSPEWHADPKNMLYWRAIQRGVSYYFPELMAGLEGNNDYETVTDEKFKANNDDLFGDTEPAANPTPTPQDDPQATFTTGHDPTPKEKREKLIAAIGGGCHELGIEPRQFCRVASEEKGKPFGEFTVGDLMDMGAQLESIKADRLAKQEEEGVEEEVVKP